jgi:hypothetical protein
MKKKLINYDVFERIEQDSLSSAEAELAEAAPIFAKALQLNCAELHCFGPSDVLYETCDGSFVHANYEVKDSYITFDNVEELVLNGETEHNKQRDLIGEMLDALLEDKEEKANQLFSEYLTLPRTRRIFVERKEEKAISDKGPILERIGKKKKKKNPCCGMACKESMQKALAGWGQMCENVFEYLDYKEYGPAVGESKVRYDDRGNPVGLRIPTTQLRNEQKLLSFDWKTLNTDCVSKRMNAKTLSEDVQFAQAVAELKRHNALSDNNALEEVLENIISKWPHVIYLTQDELSESIKSALETAGATNYDDQTCDFMAEGILRTAHHAYVDRVAKILKLAGARVDEGAEDPYMIFKTVVDQFYPALDENATVEMQVFVDLYEALRHVHKIATEENNVSLRAEASMHLNELLPIVQQEIEPSLEVAESAAEWLSLLVETNLETKDWDVSNTPHITVSGDHPAMAEKARKSYAPAPDFSGDWGDPAPASDGASYKGGEADLMRNRAYGNLGGSDVFPALNNPYVPTPFGDYKIKGEKAIEADSDQLAHWGTGDTWPGLQNPYTPAAVTPYTYKMNHGKEPDLVVDQ